MSLNKLFNYKYLLQNIKKSKMAIALLFISVPIYTSLMIIASSSSTFDFISLSAFNIFGMYIIPFMFSVCLFGYVFKKNSVDFMGSMPISRKSIFVTNTIGGIVLIILLQLITFALSVLLGALTSANVFLRMAWDIFVFQTIAYIFVFVIANLAMSLSGNIITQIAVTMLIAFIVPFSTMYIENMSELSSYDREYALMNGDIELMNVEPSMDYTAPFLIMNDGRYEYNRVSLIKMMVLSIIYFGIGLYAFNKKKMEVAGESFENKYVHFAVKGLTLIPLVAILKAVIYESEMAISLIILAIIFIYYLVFDLISSKKMKFLENVFAMLLSVITIYGFYSLAISINDGIKHKVDLKEIKTISINIRDRFNTRITEKEKIDKFILSIPLEMQKYSSYGEKRYWVSIELTQNNGKTYTKEIYLGEKNIREIFDESYKNSLIGNEFAINNEYLNLTSNEKKEIIKYLNESFNIISIKDILLDNDEENNLFLNVYEYKNHKFISTHYLITDTKIQNILLNAYNRYAVECINGGFNSDYFNVDSFGKFNDEQSEKIWFAVNRDSNHEISNFILKHEKDIPEDFSKCIRISTFKFYYFTDRIDEFMEIIDRICIDNSEDFKQYKEDVKDEYYNEPVRTDIIYDRKGTAYIGEPALEEVEIEDLQENPSGNSI